MPDFEGLPQEIKLRVFCPLPSILRRLSCGDERPTMPYLYSSYKGLSDKARTLGLVEKASHLAAAAERESGEKMRRELQMASY